MKEGSFLCLHHRLICVILNQLVEQRNKDVREIWTAKLNLPIMKIVTWQYLLQSLSNSCKQICSVSCCENILHTWLSQDVYKKLMSWAWSSARIYVKVIHNYVVCVCVYRRVFELHFKGCRLSKRLIRRREGRCVTE